MPVSWFRNFSNCASHNGTGLPAVPRRRPAHTLAVDAFQPGDCAICCWASSAVIAAWVRPARSAGVSVPEPPPVTAKAGAGDGGWLFGVVIDDEPGPRFRCCKQLRINLAL